MKDIKEKIKEYEGLINSVPDISLLKDLVTQLLFKGMNKLLKDPDDKDGSAKTVFLQATFIASKTQERERRENGTDKGN